MTAPNRQPFRLDQGGRIDRAKPISFAFDGKSFDGFAGDTLASALLASGIRLFGRSFKYHRPRGVLSAGPEEPNALVELRQGDRREPNTRATQIELYQGLYAQSQNRWPSLAFDLQAINGLVSPMLAAGFYYKTFMWPASFWEKVYEPLIRRAAGLGRASGKDDPDAYEKCTLFCDVLVIGAGPAGLAAALAAARSGARVVLCEQDFDWGGRLLSERRHIDGAPAQQWVDQTVAELTGAPDVTMLARTTAFGVYDDDVYAAVERVSDHLGEPLPFRPRQRLWRIVAKRSVLATGAIERPLVFGDNDRPGVMLAGAVRTYINRFGVVPGRNAVVFGSGDEAASTVRDLASAGSRIAAIVDARPDSSGVIRDAADRADARLFAGSTVVRARGGRNGLDGAEIVSSGVDRRVPCDLICMSGGWSPALHLASHLGHKPVWNPQVSAFVPDRLPPGMRVAGAATGHGSLDRCLADGNEAGAAAAEDVGFARKSAHRASANFEDGSRAFLWRVAPSRGKAFVDFQNDVATSDIELAEREGYRRAELMKRYTTLVMATDQGKTANVNGMAILAERTGQDIAAIGTTTFRPPYTPVAIGALAGEGRGKHFRPTRRAPTHDWSRAAGAVFVEAGAWLRAQYYPRQDEKTWFEAATREAANVRRNAGFCDVSTLGKIDVQGPDAGAFLDLLYSNTISTLPIGKSRYGLMLREDGFVLDDGTIARLGRDHWLVTTTTVNAARVLQHMEYCHALFRPLRDVQFCSVTDHWAQVALAGPRSRDILERLVENPAEVSASAFPYLAARTIRLKENVHARLFRLSFSGELGFEIAVPARHGHWLMSCLAREGTSFGLMPYGTEALSILRIEKGHPAGGELNGQTTAADLGFAKLMAKKKDFVGKVLATRPALANPSRPALVGVMSLDKNAVLGAGAHFFAKGTTASVREDLGYVTSAAFSPALGQWIGLGLLADAEKRRGSTIRAYDPIRSRDTEVRVVAPCFVDPDGERLRG